MQRMPAVSRPAWMLTLSGFADRGGGPRRSPVEIVATMGTYLTRTQAAEVSGLRAGSFGRWADGVTAMREDCAAFARHWQAHNDRMLAETGPLWVVLGDSTAQGLGAHRPDGGYVGSTGPSTRPPPPAAFLSPRSPRTSCRPGQESSLPTASTPARTATATGPAPSSARSTESMCPWSGKSLTNGTSTQ
jgi:hypothetical protein